MFDLDKDQWQELKPVLEAAAHASASDRAAVLDRALAHDPHLLACAQQMLQQYDTATRRFDSLGVGAASTPRSIDSPPPTGVAIGQNVAHYRVLRKLGEGGMGIVYLAEDERLGRQVALKFLSTTQTATVADARAQLLAESRAAAVLNHPAIVTLLELVDTGNELVAVMEYVEGRPLSALIAEPLPLGFALRLAVQLADALAYAHGRGIVHCDLKPANIHVLPSGSPKILDFGLARALAGTGYASDTQQGPLFGTPGYVAPERLLGREPGAAADVYAFGVILYRLLTGLAPFPTEDQAQLFFDTVMTLPKAPSVVMAGIPGAVDDVVMRCLAKAPRERLQPHEIARALSASLREMDTAAVAYVATSASVGGPVAGTSTAAFTKPVSSEASRVGTFAWQALLVVSVAAVSGLMTCWTFNSVIGRPSSFDPDSVLTQVVMGFRLMVTPAVIVSIVFACVGGLDLARLMVAKTRRGRGMFARLWALIAPHQGELAATLAQAAVIAGLALCVLLYLAFGDVISALMARLGSSPPIEVRPLQPANHTHVVLFRMFTSAVFVVLLIGYRTASGAAARYGGHISVNVRIALFGLMAVLLIGLQAPYKLSQHNTLPVVLHDGQRCYLLGDTAEQGRLYCPGWPVPRVRTVQRVESSINPCGFDENIFVGVTSAQCY